MTEKVYIVMMYQQTCGHNEAYILGAFNDDEGALIAAKAARCHSGYAFHYEVMEANLIADVRTHPSFAENIKTYGL